MADRFQVLFDGQPAEAAFYSLLNSLEVEENADLPGALQLYLPIAAQGVSGAEDLPLVGDARLRPYARISVVATPDLKHGACIFDGYVLSHRIHLDRGTTAATLRVWAQDVTCLMNLKETVRDWTGKTDGKAANEIFGNYGFDKGAANEQDDSPQHTEDTQRLMQRSTDAQFLRDRARHNGKLFRVCCGEEPGKNVGHFEKPDLTTTPAATLTLNPPNAATVDALDFEWDVARPSRVIAQVLVSAKDAEKGDAQESGLALLDNVSLASFAGTNVMEARLTAAADSAGELKQRSASLLREAAWFVKCEGETDLARLNAVLRVATIVQVNGAGRVHSGRYFVWSVRHTITAQSHRMRFVLVRNAVGRSS
jgi:hypothetical protein